MIKARWLGCAAALLVNVSAGAQTPSAPVQLEITARGDAYGGASFGDAGPYDKLTGIAHMLIDPRKPANRGIIDLDRAPRNARGLVAYDVDVVILRPRDPSHARRVMLYDVVNRGNMTVPTMMNSGATSTDSEKDAGNALTLRAGYTMVFSGWQGDVSGPKAIAGRFPTAAGVTDRITAETIFDDPALNRITLPYPAARMDQAEVRVTVHERTGDPDHVLTVADWSFEDDRHITVKHPLPAGADAGAVYHVSYVARDPQVMGLGFAAVRDLIAFLRHETAGNPLADLAAAPCERNARNDCVSADGIYASVVAFGGSQSGRYLKDFIWQGFNADLNGHRVFDGVLPFISGARRTFTNVRFAEPGRVSREHEDHDIPGFDFPFTYATLRDPVTGRTDGLLKRCTANGTCPKIFHVDTSSEFWQGGASLVGTGGTDHDVALPDNVRAYMVAGASHAPGITLPICSLAANPLQYPPILRSLIQRLIAWTLDAQAPPGSRWPQIADGVLSPLAVLKTPDLAAAGLQWPKVVNAPPMFGRAGWPVLVPAVDADGIDVAGVHLPQVAVPDGTYLGWNLRKTGYAPGELCSLFGGFVPFAKDDTARDNDPRPSMAARYPGDTRAMKLRQAAEALGRDGFLLDRDIAAFAGAAH